MMDMHPDSIEEFLNEDFSGTVEEEPIDEEQERRSIEAMRLRRIAARKQLMKQVEREAKELAESY